MSLKPIIPGGGSGGGSGEGPTDEQLEQIGLVANDAKQIAQGAKTESSAAAAKADAAKTTADGYAAQITAAQDAASDAVDAATAAGTKADEAKAASDAVVGTANDAKTKAEAAQTAATAAGTKADTAKATADGLETRVSAAEAAATTAGTKADGAKTTADAAKTAADAAKATADGQQANMDQLFNRMGWIETAASDFDQRISTANSNASSALTAAEQANTAAQGFADDIAAATAASTAATQAAAAADTKAVNAGTKAQQALDNAADFAADIQTAQSTADGAVNTADSALLAAQNANANLTDLQNTVGTNSDDIEANTFEITQAKARLDTAEADIDALQAAQTTNTTNIGNNTTEITNVKTRVSALEAGGGSSSGSGRAFKTLALLGDSLSGNNSDLSKLYTRGFLTFALQMSDHRVYFDHSLNFGVGGDDSAAILARVNTCIAKKPDIVLLEAAGNDINRNIAADTSIANIKATVEALLAANIRVILCTIYPTAGTTNTAHWAAVAKINQWIVDAKWRYNQVEVLDAYDVMFNNATGLVKVGYTYDTTHPASYGAWYLGRKLADLIKQMVPVQRHLKLTNPNDQFNATDFKTGNHFTNPRLTGSTGTSTGSGASGTIPTNWIVRMDEAKGATVSCAVIADDNGFNVLEITLGGTITSGSLGAWANYGHIYIGEQMGSDANTSWNSTPQGGYLRNTGTFKSITLEAEVENLVGVVAVGSEIFHLSNGGSNKPMHGDGLLTQNVSTPSTVSSSLLYPTEAAVQKLVLHNEPETHAGVANGYRFGLHISLLPGATVSGKIRISRPVMRGYEAKLVP